MGQQLLIITENVWRVG